MARNAVGIECSLSTTPLSHFVRTLHRLTDDGCLDKDRESVLDRMSRHRISIDRRDLAVPRFQHPSRSQSVKGRPLLSLEREDRDFLSMRRDVATQRIFTTDIRNMLEARDARTRNDERTNWDPPESIPPSSTGVLWRLKGVAE